jgi:hypothetical protein
MVRSFPCSWGTGDEKLQINFVGIRQDDSCLLWSWLSRSGPSDLMGPNTSNDYPSSYLFSVAASRRSDNIIQYEMKASLRPCDKRNKASTSICPFFFTHSQIIIDVAKPRTSDSGKRHQIWTGVLQHVVVEGYWSLEESNLDASFLVLESILYCNHLLEGSLLATSTTVCTYGMIDNWLLYVLSFYEWTSFECIYISHYKTTLVLI